MRVIITGGHGFLGSHLTSYFRHMGHDVFIPDRDAFDLRYAYAASAMFEAFPEPDVVVHCAARVGGIGANQRLPAEFLEDNVRINTNVVMQARRHCTRKFVGIGSVCGYPHTPPSIPFVESDYLGDYPEATNAPYGYTKRLLLMQLQAEYTQYGFGWAYLVPTNLYGPGDSFDPGSSHVIPALLRKFHESDKVQCPSPTEENEWDTISDSVTVWGTGVATRDFLYVTDACEAIYKAAVCKDNLRVPINIGSGNEMSIADLTDLIIEITHYEGEVLWDKSKPDGQPRRVLDISLADAALGWRPTVSLDTGLDVTYRSWVEELE